VAKLAPTQIEQLTTIGAHLKQVRQDQGVAIEQLANQVFIRPALLKALEEGRADELPEPVFVQGFIRRYGEALGLDGKALSQEFSVTPVNLFPNPLVGEAKASSQADAPDPVPAEEGPHGAAANGAAANGAAANGAATPVPKPVAPAPALTIDQAKTAKSTGMLWWAGGVVGLGVLVGLGVALFGGGTVPEGNAVTAPAESAAEPDATAAEPEPDATATAPTATPPAPEPTEPPPTTPDAPVVVSLNVVERSWLQVTVDGAVVFTETVGPDSSDGDPFVQTWTAQESIVVNAGNANGVELAANGSDGVVLGNPGQVRQIRITPDSDAASLQTP